MSSFFSSELRKLLWWSAKSLLDEPFHGAWRLMLWSQIQLPPFLAILLFFEHHWRGDECRLQQSGGHQASVSQARMTPLQNQAIAGRPEGGGSWIAGWLQLWFDDVLMSLDGSCPFQVPLASNCLVARGYIKKNKLFCLLLDCHCATSKCVRAVTDRLPFYFPKTSPAIAQHVKMRLPPTVCKWCCPATCQLCWKICI